MPIAIGKFTMLELSLVKITNHKEGTSKYFAVNDKHYDAMLAGEVKDHSWEWLGDVFIEDEILDECGLDWRQP